MFYIVDPEEGKRFEENIFGQRIGENLSFFNLLENSGNSLGKSIKGSIENIKRMYPNTRIGSSLYFHTKRELGYRGIDPESFLLVSTLDSFADFDRYTDGVFFLPSLYPNMVTVDAYSIDPRRVDDLKDRWVNSFEGQVYTEDQFHTDLFLYKNGLKMWKLLHEGLDEVPNDTTDFREFAKRVRPENHFIITPRDVQNMERRRNFGRLVASYFGKVASQNMAINKP